MKIMRIVLLGMVIGLFLITTTPLFAYTVKEANEEYLQIIRMAQENVDKKAPLFYIRTPNMFAVLARKVEIEGYFGYIYIVFDSAMMKAEDFPFKMKGPARYPIIVFKKN